MKVYAYSDDEVLKRYDDRLINPPEVDQLEDQIEIELKNEPVALGLWEDYEEDIAFINKKFEDYYDAESGELVADSSEIEDLVYDALQSYWPEDDGIIKVTGLIVIPYIGVINDDPYSYDDWMFDIGRPKVLNLSFSK